MRRATRATASIALLAVVGLALASCATEDPPGGPRAGPGSGSSAPGVQSREPTMEPFALIGSWVVSLADGEELGAVLRISPSDLSLWRSCGHSSGTWNANHHGLFVGEITSPGPGCPRDTTPPYNVPWLSDVVRYVSVQTGWALLRSDGTIAARLAPGGAPTPVPDVIASAADPPVATDEFLAAHAYPLPLRSGLRPATHDRLLGSWLAVVPSSRPSELAPPGLTLEDSGDYIGSDGCNSSSGRWAVGDGGAIVATWGPTTLIGCDNVDARAWLATAAWAAFDGDVLVLVDRAGKETGRLTHA